MEEMTLAEREIYHELVEEFNQEIDSMVLQEGILDSIRSGMSKVGSAAMQLVRWIAEAAKKLWSFIAALISKGIGVLMEVFGVEATATIQEGPF
jgi:phage-related protein